MAIFTQGSSAPPYNLITGFDINGDTLINDRPHGVTRNIARGAAQWNVNLRLSKTFNFGPQSTSDGPRVIRAGRRWRAAGSRRARAVLVAVAVR